MSNRLHARIAPHGLIVIGSFCCMPDDQAPDTPDGAPSGFATLIGNAGSAMWPQFSAARRDEPNPLDMWSKRVLDPVAEALGAAIVYPFDLPYRPFPRWAARTGTIFPSPMTPAIHPRYGTWFALRAAVFTVEPIVAAEPPASSPCESCDAKPCLSVCPSGAIQAKDAAICHTHLETHPHADCIGHACRARHACPIGRAYAYAPDHARFHMEAFVREFGEVMRKWRESCAQTAAHRT